MLKLQKTYIFYAIKKAELSVTLKNRGKYMNNKGDLFREDRPTDDGWWILVKDAMVQVLNIAPFVKEESTLKYNYGNLYY